MKTPCQVMWAVQDCVGRMLGKKVEANCTLELAVSNVCCYGCAQKILGVLDAIEGVISARVTEYNGESGRCTVVVRGFDMADDVGEAAVNAIKEKFRKKKVDPVEVKVVKFEPPPAASGEEDSSSESESEEKKKSESEEKKE